MCGGGDGSVFLHSEETNGLLKRGTALTLTESRGETALIHVSQSVHPSFRDAAKRGRLGPTDHGSCILSTRFLFLGRRRVLASLFCRRRRRRGLFASYKPPTFCSTSDWAGGAICNCRCRVDRWIVEVVEITTTTAVAAMATTVLNSSFFTEALLSKRERREKRDCSALELRLTSNCRCNRGK